MTPPWPPPMACPTCVRALDVALSCAACGQRYEWRSNIFRALPPDTDGHRTAFVTQYRAVRQRDNHRTGTTAHYQSLPDVPASHPNRREWALRRESCSTLMRAVAASRARLDVLDVGAGSAWLSRQFVAHGHRSVALDVMDDEVDGLGAGRGGEPDVALVQADFEHLPWAGATFDLVVFNASLHYAADVDHAVDEARRVLRHPGTLVVMDSPLFERADEGQQMVERVRASWRDVLGGGEPVGGVGFLTFEWLRHTTARLGMRGCFTPTRGTWRWRLARQLSRVRLGRAPASFGVWVAQ